MNRFIKKTFFILPVLILFSCENFFWPVKDSDSDSSVKAVSTANRTIRIPGDERDADFVMIDVNIEGGIDEIILGEDLIHGNQFSKKGCLKFQIYVNIKTWVGKN